jgi:membrane glycosyltransferase
MGRGFALWAGAEGNSLGHNAMLRTRAFAACAGLPHLPGRAPRGGVILSHDFVEAALMRRAGWGVRVMPEAGESLEDTPETLASYLRRDRRWCHGNLQHVRLLLVPGAAGPVGAAGAGGAAGPLCRQTADAGLA